LQKVTQTLLAFIPQPCICMEPHCQATGETSAPIDTNPEGLGRLYKS